MASCYNGAGNTEAGLFMLRCLLILLLLPCLSVPVLAQNTADFYATSVAVADRQTTTFRQGLREALVQVLSKVSGAPVDIVRSRPNLVQDLSQGDKLASQFIYYNHKFIDANGKEQTELRIKASFPEKRIMELLQKGGLTFWPEGRAPVRFWALLQAAGSSRWLDSDNLYQQQLQPVFSEAMLRWGFALETQHAAALNPARLWQADAAYLDAIMQSMKDQPVLLARIDTLQAQQVGGTVSLLGQPGSHLLQAATLAEWVTLAVDWASQQLAARHAVQLLTADSEVVLAVSGVADYAAYEQLLAYIESFDIVKRVYVLSSEPGMLRLAVSVKTELTQLQKRLLAGGKMTPSLVAEDSLYQLNMHWTP